MLNKTCEKIVVTAIDTQTWLTKSQQKPVVGPLLGSPLKIVASTLQLIAAIAYSIIFGLANLFTLFKVGTLREFGSISLGLLAQSGIGIAHGVIHLATLGLYLKPGNDLYNRLVKIENFQI